MGMLSVLVWSGVLSQRRCLSGGMRHAQNSSSSKMHCRCLHVGCFFLGELYVLFLLVARSAICAHAFIFFPSGLHTHVFARDYVTRQDIMRRPVSSVFVHHSDLLYVFFSNMFCLFYLFVHAIQSFFISVSFTALLLSLPCLGCFFLSLLMSVPQRKQ